MSHAEEELSSCLLPRILSFVYLISLIFRIHVDPLDNSQHQRTETGLIQFCDEGDKRGQARFLDTTDSLLFLI